MRNSIVHIAIFIFMVISWPSYCKIQPTFRSTPLSKRLREHEYSIYSLYKEGKAPKNTNKNLEQEREQLYEAYNLLHTLAQDFHKPFDAPAVIVVGHQTSGKSALIEALMGFQFNQVGGGTKTRRPIALRMQYNPNCYTPLCFLTLENGKEEQRSLADIQAYIESENKRLEKDPRRSFDPREINIRMEYRYCPNMIVIDTPGMIHPPKGRQLTPQQRALAQAAREAEALILSKIKCEDYIILCVEDTTDWKHATTRNLVMQADPQLSRTVLVTTKLDTKLPQFSEPEDLEDFLNAPLIHTLFSQLLGGPFYTSVPSGRIGNSKEFTTNDAFVSKLKHQEAVDHQYILSQLENIVMNHPSYHGPNKNSHHKHSNSNPVLSSTSSSSSSGSSASANAASNADLSSRITKHSQLVQHVGVSRLRQFLEKRVEECYRKNVAKIVPLLQSELRHTEYKLAVTEEELQSLSIERLKQTANAYREKFSKELFNLIQGTVRVSPEEFGESLEMEQLRGGHFLPVAYRLDEEAEQEHARTQNSGGPTRSSSQSSSTSHSSTATNTNTNNNHHPYHEIMNNEIDNYQHKLFGGAQYHRALKEFTLAVRHMRAPMISEDEIANAAGMGDTHNGVNFMRAACVIAMEKAQISFDPMLEALKHRTEYIMKRLFPLVIQLLKLSPLDMAASSMSTSAARSTNTFRPSSFSSASGARGGLGSGSNGLSSASSANTAAAAAAMHTAAANMMDIHARSFQDILRHIFDKFVDMKLAECTLKCRDDLYGMTKYVTWDVEGKSGTTSTTLYRSLPTPHRMVEIYNVALEQQQQQKQQKQQKQQLHEGEVDDEEEVEEEVEEIEEEEDVERTGNTNTNTIGNRIFSEWAKATGTAKKASAAGKKTRKPKTPTGGGGKKEWKMVSSSSSSSKSTPGHSAGHSSGHTLATTTAQYDQQDDAHLSDYYKVMQLTEEMLSGSSASRTNALVTALVQYIINSWRNHFASAAAMKFNCFFLMPFIHEFPIYLRDELDRLYDTDMSDMFDLSETRRVLLQRRQELLNERDANRLLQQRFDLIAQQLHARGSSHSFFQPNSWDGAGATTEEDVDVEDETSSSSSNSGSRQAEGGYPQQQQVIKEEMERVESLTRSVSSDPSQEEQQQEEEGDRYLTMSDSDISSSPSVAGGSRKTKQKKVQGGKKMTNKKRKNEDSSSSTASI